MDTPAPTGEDANLKAFAENVTGAFPGGKHIAPHLAEGPYWIAVVTTNDNPNWLADLALRAYPTVAIEIYDEWLQALRPAAAHFLPDFAHHLVQWNEEEGKLELDHDRTCGPFEQPAGLPELGENLAALLGLDDYDVEATVAELCHAVGVEQVLAYVATLAAEITEDGDSLANALRAYAAAADLNG